MLRAAAAAYPPKNINHPIGKALCLVLAGVPWIIYALFHAHAAIAADGYAGLTQGFRSDFFSILACVFWPIFGFSLSGHSSSSMTWKVVQAMAFSSYTVFQLTLFVRSLFTGG